MPIRRMRRMKRRRPKRAYKRSQLARVGFSPRRPNGCKKNAFLTIRNTENSLYNTRTQYGAEITEIAGSSTQFHENVRATNRIVIKGVRIRMNFQNIYPASGDDGTIPLYVNLSIIGSRQQELETGSIGIEDDFFKLPGATENGSSFDTANYSGLTLHTTPINTEKYAVLWHNRFVLGAKSTENVFASGEVKNYKSLSRFIRINRQVRYDSGDQASCFNKLFFVFWCSGFADPGQDGSTAPTIDGALRIYSENVVYFRDLK